MKRLLSIAILCAAASASLTGQTTVAYEGFGYLKGGCLAGGATGSGWSGAWAESGEGGSAASELIIGPGSFPVPPGFPAATGHHVDLNHQTGDRRITRRMSGTLGVGTALEEHAFSFILDLGPGAGVDSVGIELSHSNGGPVVFIGKPPGAGPGNPGVIGMDIYGQGFTSTGVAGSGQKALRLHWIPNPNGPETLIFTVSDASSGTVLGSTSQVAGVEFNQVTLIARRDLSAGSAIPSFDELRATIGAVQTRQLAVTSLNPGSGVPITISPADFDGHSSGDTAMERTFLLGASVSLTAPATAGGNNFSKWTLGGVDFSTRRTITLTMSEDRALTAVYASPPPPARTISVSSVNPSSGVAIAVSPADQNGHHAGITPFSRIHADATSVTLTAPEIPGMIFSGWWRNGTTYDTSHHISTILDGDHAFSARYTYPLDERITELTVLDHSAELAWSAVGGRTYIVEASSNLTDGFQPIGVPIVASGDGRTTLSFVETLSPKPARRFYRIQIVTP